MSSKTIIDAVDQLFEVVGVLALVVGTVAAGINYAIVLLFKPETRALAYSILRRGLGRGILVGLELLVAGDIIRTVAIEPTLQNVGALGLIVVIRTFLSWSLEVEINGRWPWQPKTAASLPVDDEV